VLINLDLDDEFDDSVFTSTIDTVLILSIPNKGITDLTGIEDFTQLSELFCHENQIGGIGFTI
jgi:Leucine-rich repeat (LRR) protein